jgi:hypothetical protein
MVMTTMVATLFFDPQAQPGHAHQSQHGRFAQVHLEPKKREREDLSRGLRPDGEADFLEPIGTSAVERFPRSGISHFELFRVNFPEHSERMHCDSQHAGHGAESDSRDEQECEQNDRQRTDEGEKHFDRMMHPVRCQVLGCQQAEEQRADCAERCAEEGNLQRDSDGCGGQA